MRLIAFVVAVALLAFPAHAREFAGASVPDTLDVRRAHAALLGASWFELRAARRANPRLHQGLAQREPVRVQIQEQGGNVYLVFSVGTSAGRAGAGTWILRRSPSGSRHDMLKILYRDDPSAFLRIYPDGERSRMEVWFQGRRLHSDLPLGLDFERSLHVSVSDLMRMSAAFVRWDDLLAHAPAHEPVRAMVAAIRSALPTLGDAEDGAMDADGRFVFIETLQPQPAEAGFNCSGFVKWIVDGLVYPRTRRLLEIEPLKAPTSARRVSELGSRHEAIRDTFFGLDWSRNLAAALDGRSGGAAARHDVRTVAYGEYRLDIGFPVGDLAILLAILAAREPGYWYIGSVNTPFGAAPVLNQHIHLAAFFPYFDEAGVFRCAVFERNRETSLASLSARYPGSFVHLVRLSASEQFDLPDVRSP